MMANPEKDTLEGTSMNNGAPATAGAPDSKASSEVLDDNMAAQAAQAVEDAASKATGQAEAVAQTEAAGQTAVKTEGEDAKADSAASATSVAESGAEAGTEVGTETGAESGAEATTATATATEAETDDADAAAKAAAEAAAEVAEWKDKYVRLHAEWDTYRRRMNEQREEEKARAAEKLVTSLLPVLDDLERTIDYAEKNGEKGLLSGVQAVLSKFVDILQKDGVQVINPKGEEFNALEAQAVGTVDDSSQPDETVADIYQKGYKIGNKVLRPAMVTVTTGGPKRPPKDTE